MIITYITIIIIVILYKCIIYSYLFIIISLIFEKSDFDQSLYRATISPHFVAIVNFSYPIIIEFTPVKSTRYINGINGILTGAAYSSILRRFFDGFAKQFSILVKDFTNVLGSCDS